MFPRQTNNTETTGFTIIYQPISDILNSIKFSWTCVIDTQVTPEIMLTDTRAMRLVPPKNGAKFIADQGGYT